MFNIKVKEGDHSITFMLQMIKYWGTGKNRYQLEIPEAVCNKIPDNYEVKLYYHIYFNTGTPVFGKK